MHKTGAPKGPKTVQAADLRAASWCWWDRLGAGGETTFRRRLSIGARRLGASLEKRAAGLPRSDYGPPTLY